MRDEVLVELRKLDLAAKNNGLTWKDRWLDSFLNALFAGMVIASIIGLIYVLSRP